MNLKLEGKVAIVTGAGSQIGYGKGMVLSLAREGCDIVVADINIEGAKQTAAEVEALGRKALAIKVDVTKRAEVDAMVKAALDKFGKIDILVNNAGGGTHEAKSFLEMTKEEWDSDINLNLYGQLNCAQAVLPHMIARHYGRIINVSGGQGVDLISMYGAAKAGVEAWTRALAKEVASSGVIVNGVLPGFGATEHTIKFPIGPRDSAIERSPLGRLCTPEDVGPVVAFLASDVCSYMVGQFIRCGVAA